MSNSSYYRNLNKSQLGGVIFGCNNATIHECLSKQLFGLPGPHYCYVKNIDPGLPLFLFNYTDKKLHGIFEAASLGQMNIDPYGWTADGSQRCPYPAQVLIRVRLNCHPLSEERFKPIIQDNYFNRHQFWFELDHAQTSKLQALFSSSIDASGSSIPTNRVKLRPVYKPVSSPGRRAEGSENNARYQSDPRSPLERNVLEKDHVDLMHNQLQKLDLHKDSTKEQSSSEENNDESPCTSSNCQSIIAQLVQGMEELKAFKNEQSMKMFFLEETLFKAEEQIRQLKDRCALLESQSSLPLEVSKDTNSDTEISDDQVFDPTKSIFLVGGYDGESWLSALDLYSPSRDASKSLKTMSTVRSYTSIVRLNDEFYVLGGGEGNVWYDSVESYNPATDEWTLRPSLTGKKGSLGSATLDGKIYAVGGGNGSECFSEVEMLDLDIGRWIPTRSMLQKRFALAAVEYNGVLYATGGFDGSDYLRSAERFDPREHSWAKIASMNTSRGCHSLVVLNEKLYALGGFDGDGMVSSTEIYDPRMERWMNGEEMKQSRGYSAAAVVEDCIYVIGGVKSGDNILDTVESFKEGETWQETVSKSIGKRCFFSAFVL
ncbi:DCD (Development and Cell Death) domain protein [Euphorbia peplus]|nr:DCD (Development and Cell Death) domain protein [Euphorbia peplus]